MKKVAVITGGTTGIGRQIAITLAKNGYDIAIIYLSENEDVLKTKNAIESTGNK